MSRGSRVERIAGWFRAGARVPARRGASILLDRVRFAEARIIIGAYYAILFFVAVGTIYSWPTHLAATEPTPRWAIAWLDWVDLRRGIGTILWLHLIGGLAAITLVRYRAARILVSLSLLWFLSLTFSFGSINHGDHLGLLISCVLIFLPAGWSSAGATRSVRVATMLVFSACQALILMIYSMSGLWKAIGVVRQVCAGESNYLMPSGLAQLIAAKLLGADATTPLGPLVIEHPWLGWPLGAAAIYVELVALWIVFRPSLHRLWGLGLIMLHLFALLTMGVGFVQNMLWLALFLVFSPFRPLQRDLHTMLFDLPLFGPLFEPLFGRLFRSGSAA